VFSDEQELILGPNVKKKKCSEFMSYNGPAGILEYKTIKIDNVMSSSVPGIIRLVFNITVRYTRIPQ